MPSLRVKMSLASAASLLVGAIKDDMNSSPRIPIARPICRIEHSLAKSSASASDLKGTKIPRSSEVTGWSFMLTDTHIAKASFSAIRFW